MYGLLRFRSHWLKSGFAPCKDSHGKDLHFVSKTDDSIQLKSDPNSDPKEPTKGQFECRGIAVT